MTTLWRALWMPRLMVSVAKDHLHQPSFEKDLS